MPKLDSVNFMNVTGILSSTFNYIFGILSERAHKCSTVLIVKRNDLSSKFSYAHYL